MNGMLTAGQRDSTIRPPRRAVKHSIRVKGSFDGSGPATLVSEGTDSPTGCAASTSVGSMIRRYHNSVEVRDRGLDRGPAYWRPVVLTYVVPALGPVFAALVTYSRICVTPRRWALYARNLWSQSPLSTHGGCSHRKTRGCGGQLREVTGAAHSTAK